MCKQLFKYRTRVLRCESTVSDNMTKTTKARKYFALICDVNSPINTSVH